MDPHPSTCIGNPSKTFGTYIWWAYLLEEKDMKWDPCLERNAFLIIKDISYKSSKIKCPTKLEIEITGSSQVVAFVVPTTTPPLV